MACVTFFVTLFIIFIFQLHLLHCDNIQLQAPNISPQCELEGICDSVENYPTELVKELIKRLQGQNTIFNYDEAPLPTIYSRFNAFEEEPMNLCDTNPRQCKRLEIVIAILQYIPAKAAKDMKGRWQYIINDSQEPIQVFKTETCSKVMGSCSKKISFGPGYDGVCLQRMVFREMFYINETKQIGKTYFEVPICCSCSLLRKDDKK